MQVNNCRLVAYMKILIPNSSAQELKAGNRCIVFMSIVVNTNNSLAFIDTKLYIVSYIA